MVKFSRPRPRATTRIRLKPRSFPSYNPRPRRNTTLGYRPNQRKPRLMNPRGFPSSAAAVGRPRKVSSLNGNVTNSIVKYYSRPSRQVLTMEKVGAPNQYTDQYSFRVDNEYGFQDICSFSFNGTYQLANLPQYIGMPGITGVKPYRYVLQSIIGNITMANASTAPIELEIYDLVLKRDLPTNINISQNNINWNQGSVNFPDTMWKYFLGMNNGDAPTTLALSKAHNIGASPFDCSLWKNYFKVKKRTQVLLTQGGVHRHAVLMKPNKLLDSTMFNQGVSTDAQVLPSLNGLQGLTTYVMIVQKGFPVSDAAAAATVTTSSGSVCYVQDWRYKYTWVADNVMSAVNGDSLTTPAAGQIINIGSGLPEDIAYTV